MSFFVYLMRFFVVLTTTVQWVNDVLVIPLFGDIESVKNQPEARLYVDGYWVVGARVTYERNGVEWTYLSTVNTAHVRNYTIKYRAYFPDYNLYDVHPITFSVVDVLPPVIVRMDEVRVSVGEKMPDLKQNLIVTDNYYAYEDLTIVFDTSGVNLSRVGRYTLYVRISDPSGNITHGQTMFHVVDLMPPSITILKPIIINVNSTWQWQSFFSVKDNVDTVLTVVIDDQHVNYHLLGTYTISVNVTDRSGNQIIETIMVEVKDLDPPTLQLRTKMPVISLFENIDRDLLESYIVSLDDNFNQLNVSDVIITHDIDANTPGTYTVIYRVMDESNNVTQKELKVSVQDITPPIIVLTDSLEVDVFSVEPFWITFFEYSDNYTSKERLTIKLSTSVKMNIVGEYPISLDISDASGNLSSYRGYIRVIDRIPPTVIQLSDVVITDFTKKPLEFYFQATDQYDTSSQLTIIIDDQDVDYETIGMYQAWCEISDRSSNQTRLAFDIMVIDQTSPTLTLTKTRVEHSWGKEPIDFILLIDEASDNYDGLSKEHVIIEHEVDWQSLGQYEVHFTLTDYSFNTTHVQLVVIIDDRIPPTLHFDDLIIRQYDDFDFWEGVQVSDNHLIQKTYVFPSHIDSSKPGRHLVTYVAMDERGNYVTKDRLITIEPEIPSYELQSLLPIGVILCIGGVILYIIYKKG